MNDTDLWVFVDWHMHLDSDSHRLLSKDIKGLLSIEKPF